MCTGVLGSGIMSFVESAHILSQQWVCDSSCMVGGIVFDRIVRELPGWIDFISQIKENHALAGKRLP